MLAYFLKINVAIALFYAFYRLFFHKDTFFGWRRVALLSFFALAATYPLLNIQSWITEQEPMVAMVDLYANVVLPEFTLQATTTNWESLILDYAAMAYWGIVSLLSIRFLIQLAAIIHRAIRCRKTQIGTATVHLLPQSEGPFSFFHWIFIHPSSHAEEELNEILTHEQTHARQWHSIDVLVSEIFCILCWFNPFAWLMKREIRTNLEYMADDRVLETGYDSKTYQFHLLGLSHHKAAATIYNSFNVLPLKKRIKMMNKKRTREIGRTKYLLFLPLAALLLLISNIEAVARTTKEIAKEVLEVVDAKMTTETPKAEVATESIQIDAQAPRQEKLVTYQGKIVDNEGNPVAGIILGTSGRYKIADEQLTTNKEGEFSFQAPVDVKVMAIYQKDGKYTAKNFSLADLKENNARIVMNEKWQEFLNNDDDQGDPIFEVVDKMPEFPEGGTPGLMRYLSKSIQYPANAKKNGTQGRITVQFVVNTDGSISNAKLCNKIDPELDAEAIRVISNMPKWKPGTHEGKAVRVRYTAPIVFKLGENKSNKNNQIASSKIDETVVVAYTPTEAEASSGEEIYEVVEGMPSFAGGMPGLMKYLSANIKYPIEAQKAKVQGRAVVQVIINKEGKVTAPRIIRTSKNALLDAEAIRVVSTMPKWSPGTEHGKPVSVKYTMPIMFKLQ